MEQQKTHTEVGYNIYPYGKHGLLMLRKKGSQIFKVSVHIEEQQQA